MRFILPITACFFFASSTLAQPRQPSRPPELVAHEIEQALARSSQAFIEMKKLYERDLAILDHLLAAEDALADTMQPSTAIQTAWNHVSKAKGLGPEFYVRQGVILIADELDQARRSPTSADFGRLHAILNRDAIGPAKRLVARNAMRLQEETIVWLKVQDAIGAHLQQLTSLATESLRKTELEE